MDHRALYDTDLERLRRRAPELAGALDPFVPDFTGTYTVVVGREGLKVNGPWYAGLDAEERVTCLASVGFRMTSPLLRPCGDRNPFVWNLACSAITNANLAHEGFRLPRGALLEPTCRDLDSDAAYERIKDVPGLSGPPTGMAN